MRRKIKLNKKKKSIEISKHKPCEDQIISNRAKIYDFYVECYRCRICEKIHDPISLRTFDHMPDIFDMVQILADRYAGKIRNHGIKKAKVLKIAIDH